MSVRSQITKYGLTFGAAEITRMFSNKDGSVTLGLGTPKFKNGMQIYVTKTGKVRVFGADGVEWGPKQ